VVSVRQESSTLFVQFISLPGQLEYLDSLGELRKQNNAGYKPSEIDGSVNNSTITYIITFSAPDHFRPTNHCQIVLPVFYVWVRV
jgi:hypothetical protein